MRLKVGPHWGFFLGPSLGEKWEERSDEEVGEWGHGRVMDGLAKEGERVERPKKVRFTTWRSDEFSTGSYTFIPPATRTTNPTPLDILELARPIWDGRLGFAGEHSSVNHYASTRGAWLSGVREAERVWAKIQGQEVES